MKPVVALSVAAALCVVCACPAPAEDYAGMSDAQLHALIDGARAELDRRAAQDAGEIVAFDRDGHRLTLSNMRAGNYSNSRLAVVWDAVYTNDSDGAYRLIINGSYVNRWTTGALESPEATPGHRQMFQLVIPLDATDLSSLGDIESVELEFGALYPDYDYSPLESRTIYPTA